MEGVGFCWYGTSSLPIPSNNGTSVLKLLLQNVQLSHNLYKRRNFTLVVSWYGNLWHSHLWWHIPCANYNNMDIKPFSLTKCKVINLSKKTRHSFYLPNAECYSELISDMMLKAQSDEALSLTSCFCMQWHLYILYINYLCIIRQSQHSDSTAVIGYETAYSSSGGNADNKAGKVR